MKINEAVRTRSKNMRAPGGKGGKSHVNEIMIGFVIGRKDMLIGAEEHVVSW